MSRGRAHPGRLDRLLLTSLLLHLVVLFAAGALLEREPLLVRAGSSMVVEYLDTGADKGAALAGATSRQPVPTGAAPPGLPAAAAATPAAGRSAAATLPSPQQAPLPAASFSPARQGAAATEVKSGSADASPAGPGAARSHDSKGASPVAAQLGGGAPGGASVGVSPAVAPASGASVLRRGAYQSQLRSLIEAHKQYPLACRRSGREGSCQRRLTVARDGSLKRVEALSSCGHPFLDAAATRAITDVGGFPPLPEEFRGAEESFSITITFALARK